MAGSRIVDTDPRLSAPTREAVVDWFRSCSIEELRAVIVALEEAFELPQPPPFSTSNPPWLWDDATGNPPWIWGLDARLTLLEVGPRRVEVFRALKRELGWTLLELRDRLEALPLLVIEDGDREQAQRLHEALQAAGARSVLG